MSYTFDRVLAQLKGLNDIEEAGPTTVQDVVPMVGDVTTVVTQLIRQNDFDARGNVSGAKFTMFLQTIQQTPSGPTAVQVVIPDKAVRRIAAQWEALNRRNRRFLKERARERAKANPTGFAAITGEPPSDAEIERARLDEYFEEAQRDEAAYEAAREHRSWVASQPKSTEVKE